MTKNILEPKEFSLVHVLTTYSGKGCDKNDAVRLSDVHNVLRFVTQDDFSFDWMGHIADKTMPHVVRLVPWLAGACEQVRAICHDRETLCAYVDDLIAKHGEMVTLYPDAGYEYPNEMVQRIHAAQYGMTVIEVDDESEGSDHDER